MKKNLTWPLLLSIVSIVVVIFTSLLSIDLYHYYFLRHSVPIEDMQASIKQVSANKFCVEVDYLYQVNSKKYSRHQELKGETYKNLWLANRKIESLEASPPYVWYNSHKPQNGIINKKFPYRRLFSTCTLYGIFMYFCLLSRLVLRRV